MDHHDNKYTINFKHFPQDANARCHSLEQITNRDNFTGWEDYPEDERID